MADVRRAGREWDEMGSVDPCWMVLVEPDRKRGGWESPEGHEEFFRTGREEVAGLLREVEALGLSPRRGAVLDFGCGVGRLTRALAAHFERCDGVDVSPSMVRRAREMNADLPNCRFLVNAEDRLSQLPDGAYDLVYSSIVLQHVPGKQAILGYVREFVRVLRPGGLVAFQLPARIPWKRRIQPRRRLFAVLRTLGLPIEFLYGRLGLYPMRMGAVPEAEVVRALESAGARVAAVRPDASAGPEVESRMYFALRLGADTAGNS